jgi:hypothetical protein
MEDRAMKKVLGWLVALVLIVVTTGAAQFRSKIEPKPAVNESLIRQDGGNFLVGWFDPSRLTMRHSFSLSYQTFGGKGLSVGSYTNSIFYKFSDPLDVQFDVSMIHSPFNSFGRDFQDRLSGVYLSRAQLNYRPSDNILFQIQYRQVPAMYWMMNSGYGVWDYGYGRSPNDDH